MTISIKEPNELRAATSVRTCTGLEEVIPEGAMKIYCVVTERAGKTVKAPDVSQTELAREILRFAAASLAEVWSHVEYLRADPECELIGIYEEHPAITVLRNARIPQGFRIWRNSDDSIEIMLELEPDCLCIKAKADNLGNNRGNMLYFLADALLKQEGQRG